MAAFIGVAFFVGMGCGALVGRRRDLAERPPSLASMRRRGLA